MLRAVWRSLTAALTLAVALSGVVFSVDRGRAEELSRELERIPFRIVYETYRDNNWELFISHADGSNPVNMTRSPNINEIYPHASPDAERLSFLVQEGEGVSTRRHAYYMNCDGTNRRLISKDVRWTCWSPDGKVIAYLKNEPGPFSYKDGTTKGLCFYDLERETH
jgi:Tol biopolymer transport system component